MVGMEKIEVLSKSYLVRWINVNAGNTISWSLQPNKKSLNFGIFKHPGGQGAPGIPNVPPSDSSDTPSEVPTTVAEDKDKKGKVSKNETKSSVVEKLEKTGMKVVSWIGNCEADKVSVGQFNVVEGEGGMYGLVFDNTFSKQVAKTATFVLMTYPTNAPPTSGHHLHFSQASVAATSSTSLPRTAHSGQAGSNSAPGLAAISTDSLPQSLTSVAADPRPRSRHLVETKSFGGSTFYTGVMHKRRRKQHNSYSRRFFSLDFATGTLSYYRNRHSSALRGAIPLSLAAVGMNERNREISVDSGAEIWHLKVGNQRDFIGWRDALERASRVATGTRQRLFEVSKGAPAPAVNIVEENEWVRVETLVSHVSGIRDAVRRLAKDTDPKYKPSSSGLAMSGTDISPARSPSTGSFDFTPKDDDQRAPKLPFWKRTASSSGNSSPGIFKRSVSSQLAAPNAGVAPISVPNGRSPSKTPYLHTPAEDGIHDHCMELLRDLDGVVADFSNLINESKQRRRPVTAARRPSITSTSSDEFFDAEEGRSNQSQLLEISRDSQEFEDREEFSDGASDSSVDVEEDHFGSFKRRRTTDEENILFPSKAKSLTPLPLDAVTRRTTVPPPKQAPPSLISFFRKNVGKDLSTIAMPVSSNEPTSLLQRMAEQLEYSELLDTASSTTDPSIRLLYIAAFAISSFSVNRVKERAMRKPFTPMLGETFELIREDKGFRLLTEKISHRPLRMAVQAESKNWSFLQSPLPIQKFWGKSAELNTEGCARVFLHEHGEVYSYTHATSFLRNVIAGEKYVEPVSTMTVVNESSGAKALVTFKAGGMFAGRSEEVGVQLIDEKGIQLSTGAAGKWTSHLQMTTNGHDSGTTLWKTGSLVDSAQTRYGLTAFAAQMNEITPIEENHVPISDTRLRPDQRALEAGDMDRAEALKAKLEERQRGRRRVLEEHNEDWAPRWFVKAGTDGEEDIWRMKTGKDSYWEERAKGQWTGVVDVFET